MAALACLGLTLTAAALDRRNAVLDRTGTSAPARQAPTPAALVGEMMTHD